MKVELQGKVAMVTGGTRGIGLACAKQLAESGAQVALIGRTKGTVAKGVEIISKKGFAKGYQLDVSKVAEIERTVEKIRKELGEIDILLCSAGVDLAAPTPAVDITEEEWDKLHSVNAKGMFFTNQAVAKQSMIPRKKGSIINIGSAVGLVGAPMCMAYNTSKAVVTQMTRSEAIEWGKYNIRVNCVAPTWVYTDLSRPLLSRPGMEEHELSKIPIGHFATLEEIANTVCFLASDLTETITGTSLLIDGGWTAH